MSWRLPSEAASHYLTCCRQAATNENYFNVFKTMPGYRHVLEHISEEEGQQYYDLIDLDIKEEVKKNDTFGSPDLYEYPCGKISPTTLRYVKNTCDIVRKFGTSFDSIVEIGGGYGGLCVTSSNYINFDSYLILDQEEPNQLTRKYVSNWDLPHQSCRLDELRLEDGHKFDLCISNYAFSECDRETQTEYLYRIVGRARNLYFVYNTFTENIQLQEFLDRVSDRYDVEYEDDHEGASPQVIYAKEK